MNRVSLTSLRASCLTPITRAHPAISAVKAARGLLRSTRSNVLDNGIQHVLLATTSSSGRSSVVTAASGQVYEGDAMSKNGQKYAIVVARFNSLITKGLLEGAKEAFHRFNVAAVDIDVVWVPGSFELPIVAKAMARSGRYSAVLCIGAVIRGTTAHYDAVVSATTSGILNAGLDSGIPVIFGVLTCDTLEQALDRTGGKVGNKGFECAVTAIETANLMGILWREGKALQI